jgi:hypothetical protein
MRFVLGLIILVVSSNVSWAQEAAEDDTAPKAEATYDHDEIIDEVENFFGEGAEGLAEIVAKAFEDQGRPNAFIAGEEAGGAIVVGLRYGRGTLEMKSGPSRQVYWQGPSVGFDLGADVAKVFILIYNLHDVGQLFQRFPGVEGSLYFVGGVGINYLAADDVVVAPIRFGAGWRQGVSAGYLQFTREASANPF